MSLSFWLRDDPPKPAPAATGTDGFNTDRNLMITMLLGGIWHGAAWKFVMWGALHGGGLAVERMAYPLIGQRPASRLGAIGSWLVVFHFVCFAWISFAPRISPSPACSSQGLAHGWAAGISSRRSRAMVAADPSSALPASSCRPARSSAAGLALARVPYWGLGVGCWPHPRGDQRARLRTDRLLHLFPVLRHGRPDTIAQPARARPARHRRYPAVACGAAPRPRGKCSATSASSARSCWHSSRRATRRAGP